MSEEEIEELFDSIANDLVEALKESRSKYEVETSEETA